MDQFRHMNNYQIKNTSLKTGGALVTTLFLLSGTGASFPLDAVKEWKEYVKPNLQVELGDSFEHTESIPAVDVRTTSQHIENIRNILALPMSELAKDLGVTRQALYKWLSGESQPEDQNNADYILILSNVADQFSNAGILNAKLLMKMKAFEGYSLLDLVKKEGDWSKHVNILIKEAKLSKNAGEKINSIVQNSIPNEEWKSSVSIPGTTMEG